MVRMDRSMKGFLAFSLTVLLAVGFADAAAAETKIGLDGQIRVRTELDDRLFGKDYIMSRFTLLRTRLGVGATVDDNAKFYVQFQDSRRLGSNSQSGSLVSTSNVDVHQAYFSVKRLWVDGLGMKLGRFEVSLGNERVFGPVGWSNVGRSWEGGMIWYKAEKVTLRGLALKGREFNRPFVPVTENRDFDILGVVADVVDPALQLFFVYEYDADTLLALDGGNNLDRVTLGGYFKNEVEDMNIDYELNAAYQTGTIYDPYELYLTNGPTDPYDINAFLLAFEAGYSFEGERPARVAGAIDYTSGDDDMTDTDWKAYNNLYPTSHKFRGYMDYFVGSEPEGLIDLIARAQVEFAPNWWLAGDLHWFRKAQEYEGLDGDMTTDAGTEIDFTLKTNSVEGVDMVGGASVFFPTEDFAFMEDPNTGMWFYYQLIVNFK